MADNSPACAVCGGFVPHPFRDEAARAKGTPGE
jgi:hypothetical protein